jgi:hypothetical protein
MFHGGSNSNTERDARDRWASALFNPSGGE